MVSEILAISNRKLINPRFTHTELASKVARLVFEHGEIDQFGRPRDTY